MADVYGITYANLNAITDALNGISKDLRVVNNNVNTVNDNVGLVDDNVKVVYDELGALARDFHEFVSIQIKANRLNQAETRLVKIRQEIDKKFGHYDIVRRTTTGILQADDLGLVKKSTITNATEEMMLSTPGYWLAPCLVALAAWINDQPELAQRALREGIKRNDEKTSLFFTLVCRRADRKQSSLKWAQRYLEGQDEENLDRKAVIILDAFASGLLGADTEGVISKQMGKWLENLSEKPGFVEQQTSQWSEAINQKRKPVSGELYPYLRKYSKTWPQLEYILEGAYLHATILSFFIKIFDQEASTDSLKEQLDEVLTSLVSDFDDEELSLRRDEKLEQFIVDFEGDEKRAQSNMAMEQSAFDTHKDFTQLLTDAAMRPESSHASVSTQKFAIALSKDWVSTAYNDTTAQNRMNIPDEIEINVDTFDDKTTDGKDEEAVMGRWNSHVDGEMQAQLNNVVLSMFEKFCLYGGAAISGIGVVLMFMGGVWLFIGLVCAIAGVIMIVYNLTKQKAVKAQRQEIIDHFNKKRDDGGQIIRAVIAEIVDFRAEFAQKDSESVKVTEFLEQISPDQYVRKLADSNRRIKVASV